MKKNITKSILMVSKYLFIGYLMQMFCISMLLANETAAQRTESVRDLRLSIVLEDATLEEAFSKIEAVTDLTFSYHKNEVKTDERFTFNSKQASVADLLLYLSEKANVKFKQINNNISVSKRRKFLNKGESALEVYLQGRTITGKITSEDTPEGLPGVNVIIKGTNTGTVTDIDGNYSIDVPSGDDVLVFSSVGFVKEEVQVGNQSVINMSLVPDITSLEEIVVVGFGTKAKKDLTGSISQVNAEDIEDTQFPSPQFALQGKSTGVRVVNTSGDPTEAPEVFIRGVGTWRSGAQPLYVIDGQVINPRDDFGNDDTIGDINPWTFLNPNDIESISVLKDASAAAIYGSRAANGVILITTRRGKQGKPRVEFTARTSIQNIDKFDVLDSEEMMDIHRERWTNSLNPNDVLEEDFYGREADGTIITDLRTNGLGDNFHPQYDPQSPFYIENPVNVDWQDAILNKNSTTQDYSLRISGASESADYYFSLGYTNQESVFVGKELDRYNISTNLNTDIGKYIRTGLTARLAYHETLNDNYPNDLSDVANNIPFQPIMDPSNKYGYQQPMDYYDDSGAFAPVRLFGGATTSNPFPQGELNTRNWESVRSAAQGYLEIEPIEGLTIKGSASADWQWQRRLVINSVESEFFSITPEDPASIGDGSSKGTAGLRDNLFINLQYDLNIRYNKNFGDHSINLFAGAQDTRRLQRFSTAGADQINTADPRRIGWSNNLAFNTSIHGRSEAFWFGYVGRAGYNYASKYYIDLSYRRDASNGFPEDTRWGNFYSASGAWRISDEDFMSGLIFIDDLKLRGGWGQAGNDADAAGSFAYLSNINATGTYRLGSGAGDPLGTRYLGNALLAFPNKSLSWEVVNTTTIGFDAYMFNNAIETSFEYYARTTDGILQSVQLPNSVGVNNPLQNIGRVRNSGIELSLGYNTKVGDLKIHVDGNISTVKNEVLELYEGNALSRDGNRRIEEGRPIDFIYGYQVEGMFQSREEALDHYVNNYGDNQVDTSFVDAGDLYFKNVYGQPNEEYDYGNPELDTLVDANDRDMIGKTIPGFIYGLNINLEYKGIYLTANFYGEGDVDKINSARRNMESMSGPGNYLTSVRNRYREGNTNTDIPRAVVGDPAGNNRISDRWVESAAFFRLNQWQFGYNFPQSLLSSVNFVQKLNIYIGGNNNLYISNWSTVDPVNDQFPLPKTYTVGLKATF